MNIIKIAATGIVLSLGFAIPAAFATTINFETAPGGGTPTDDEALTGIYMDGGTNISFGYDPDKGADLVAEQFIYFEEYGDPDSDGGTTRAYAEDGDDSGLGIDFFLRIPNPPNTNSTLTGRFLVTYAGVLPSAASGSIWDLDLTEIFKVTAYDAAKNVLASQTFSGDVIGSHNNLPTDFSFSGLSAGIGFIGITSSTGSPFGFDNFNATSSSNSIPAPATVILLVCGLGLLGMSRHFV
jgi:hypothetical protein